MRRAPLKAPGPDGWTPHLMRALTATQCHRLASIMREAELCGTFPEQWARFAGSFASKKPGDRKANSLDACSAKNVDETQVEPSRTVATRFRRPGLVGFLWPWTLLPRRGGEASHPVRGFAHCAGAPNNPVLRLELLLRNHNTLEAGYPCTGCGLSTPAAMESHLCLPRTKTADCRWPCCTTGLC